MSQFQRYKAQTPLLRFVVDLLYTLDRRVRPTHRRACCVDDKSRRSRRRRRRRDRLVNNTSALICCSQVRRRCVLCQWPVDLFHAACKLSPFRATSLSTFSATQRATIVIETMQCHIDFSRQRGRGIMADLWINLLNFYFRTIPILYEAKTQNTGEFTYFVSHRRDIDLGAYKSSHCHFYYLINSPVQTPLLNKRLVMYHYDVISCTT